MRGISLRHSFILSLLAFLIASPMQAQDTFRWMDFHSDKDQAVIVWVTRALSAERWTAIREIGVLYDAALVVTTTRASADASPAADTFNVWSVNLTNHAKTPLLTGVNLRWLDWLQFSASEPRELGVLYDDCGGCTTTTYFTSFHYDGREHIFVPRWMRGGRAVPLWTTAAPEGVNLTQVYAVLPTPSGLQYLATWSHFDYGKEKPPEDYIFRYDIDPLSGLDRTELLSNKDADAMKQRVCGVQGTPDNLARGQDSALCQETLHPRAERKPVTSPPANNRGRSTPPGTPRP